MINQYLPLTQSQSLLWIGQELNPESPMYNMVMTYELNVQVSETNFKLAFLELIKRYDVLRAVFVVKDGKPYQTFLPENKQELLVLDFSKEDNPKEAYLVWEKNRIVRKFDTYTSLLDSALVKLDDAHYIWFINQHHLITDAWSNGLLFKAITNIYQKLENSETIAESSKDVSFETYSKQEIVQRLSPKNDISKAFWTNKIKETIPVPNLYHQDLKSDFDSASTRHYINLGKERSRKLRALANEKGIRVWTEHLSLYNVFLTTLFAYLYRVSGQEKIAVGSPTHNRFSKVAKETVGYFVEIFPLFATLSKKETFLSLLQKIQIESNDFLKHAKPGISSPALHKSFHVLFNYIHADYADFNGISVASEWVHSGHHDPRHKIRLHVHDLHNTGEIQLYFDFNNQVFNAEKQQHIPKHFIALLDAFIADKTQAIEAPSIITGKELEDIENTFYSSEEHDDYTNLIALIEQQVVKTPIAPSIVFEDISYTYKTLNEKVNQLAHYLRAQDIGVNTQVAIWLKRSPEYIISVLAVLKTGATYIPIPFNYPSERVKYILEDSKSSLTIVQEEEQIATVKETAIATLITENVFKTVLVNYSIENIEVDISKDTTAFLIYTSGSTGKPKGVKITHEAVANYILWTEKAYLTSHNIQQPSVPLFTTVGFDITANSVFLPLICGGNIRVYQEKDADIDLSILDVIEENKVDFIKLTPAHLSFLKGKNLLENSTKVMVVTGDEFKTELAVSTTNLFNEKLHIYNEYGPSEATIGCIYHKFDLKNDTKATVPIGLPIDGMQTYILDGFLNPVPKGVVGNLYLGGKGLSNGYWNKEQLTAEKFIDNPLYPSSKIYNTGDLARINNNSIIEFLGRKDFQVKINGYRIELGEIEAQISKYANIVLCTVLVLENKEGIKSLAAYFSAKETINSKDLQLFLANRLPKYMVPNHYKQLKEFPLSANGKVDRKELAVLETEKVDHQIVYIAPRNEIEEEVADIWKKVFNIEKVSVLESFIVLGGESLMAIQINTRINETFEFKMPLNKIFELQTIERVSNYIEEILTQLLEE